MIIPMEPDGFHARASRSLRQLTGPSSAHDLRRTARSLMSRAGVNPDIAERCLGHVIGGVRGVYDRHQYIEEMHHAFEALASQIERIVHPVENVVAVTR
jgi:integrase